MINNQIPEPKVNEDKKIALIPPVTVDIWVVAPDEAWAYN